MTIVQWFMLSMIFFMVSGCQKPPDFTAVDNQAIYLKNDTHRWTVLNIWALWCGPCREEIPELNLLAQHNTVNVIGHDFDADQGERLKRKIDKMGITFPVIEDSPFDRLEQPSPQVLPATFLIDPNGVVVDTLYGPQTEESITAQLKQWQTTGASSD